MTGYISGTAGDCSRKRQKIPKLAALTLCAALPISCAVGPDYRQPPLNLPQRWHNSANPEKTAPASGQNSAEQAARSPQSKQQALAGWWRQLRDPQLNALIDIAMADNLTIAAAKARRRAARALAYQTSGALLPSADAGGSAARRKQGNAEAGDYYNGNFDAAWELDLFGGNKRATEAAQAGFTASAADLRAAAVSLIGDIAANYVEIRRLQAQLQLSRRTAQSQRQTADLVERKFRTGAASALDYYNAAGQAADMEADIPRRQQQLVITEHRLALLLGQAPADLNSLLLNRNIAAGSGKNLMKKSVNAAASAGRSGIPAIPKTLPRTIPADILVSRPDIYAAERRLAQATAIIGQKQAALYPSIRLTGNIAANGLHLGDLGKNSAVSRGFGPSINLPLFHGGSLLAGVELARAERDQNFLTLRSTVLTALEDVENALITLHNSRQTAQKKTEAAQAYRRSMQLSHDLYDSGNSDFLQLLTAERSYFYAEQGALDAFAAGTTAYISLMKALGGGWDGVTDYRTPEIIDKNTGPHFIKTAAQSSREQRRN